MTTAGPGSAAAEIRSASAGSPENPLFDGESALHRDPTRARQFAAVLRKNYLLQTRSRRLWWSGAGWLALLVEVQSVLCTSKLDASCTDS
jgi:hypothetical protein